MAMLGHVENLRVPPACTNSDHSLQPTDVVFVPTGADPVLGFQHARTLLQQRRSVQLIGTGITLSENWPDWVTAEPNLLLTELSAYQPAELVKEFLPLRAGIDEWLDTIFAEVVRGFRGHQIFYGEATLRLFQPIIEAFPALINLTKRNGAVRYHCANERWSGLELLRNLADQNGGSLEARAPRKSVFGPVTLLVSVLAAFTGTVLDQLRAYMKESPSRAKLRRLRLQALGRAAPRFWVVLIPDWIRINQHVLESMVKPALQRGEPLGVLLSGTLQPGARMESNMRARTGSELWPGLGLLQHRIDQCSADQVISAESVGEFLDVCTQALRQSIRVLLRLASRPSRVRSGALHFDLAKHKWQLAKLVTKDIWTAIAAERASREAIRRNSFAGTTVILASAASSPLAVTDLILQNAGATTVDFAHGSPGNWLGDSPSVSTLKCVWTQADAASVSPFGQPTIVAGTPRTVGKNYRPSGYKARNILIVSNYAQRDPQISLGFPEFALQEELLAVVRVIRDNFGERFRFRWRPHPADIEKAVRGTLKQYPGVDLSRGHPLAVDVAWTDLIITSISSAVPQFLLAEIPIFLHVRPGRQHAPEVTCFAAKRKFFRAHDLQQAFAQCIAVMDRGDQSALDPEKGARVAFFGPSGEPASLFDLLEEGQVQVSNMAACSHRKPDLVV